ncbi:hypothetical protein XBFFL1_2040031 [Xenorhabdus bovienii str. feltiae Florida]|nr:hypothetical protein XBFFR1_1010030 [Xenorhabdus bovienii str. feltiae France]CDG92240.1 hypothetical protein XBFFL1_2040031 [Xenorhabdus bovienii str. feltiae Florida]
MQRTSTDDSDSSINSISIFYSYLILNKISDLIYISMLANNGNSILCFFYVNVFFYILNVV